MSLLNLGLLGAVILMAVRSHGAHLLELGFPVLAMIVSLNLASFWVGSRLGSEPFTYAIVYGIKNLTAALMFASVVQPSPTTTLSILSYGLGMYLVALGALLRPECCVPRRAAATASFPSRG